MSANILSIMRIMRADRFSERVMIIAVNADWYMRRVATRKQHAAAGEIDGILAGRP